MGSEGERAEACRSLRVDRDGNTHKGVNQSGKQKDPASFLGGPLEIEWHLERVAIPPKHSALPLGLWDDL